MKNIKICSFIWKYVRNHLSYNHIIIQTDRTGFQDPKIIHFETSSIMFGISEPKQSFFSRSMPVGRLWVLWTVVVQNRVIPDKFYQLFPLMTGNIALLHLAHAFWNIIPTKFFGKYQHLTSLYGFTPIRFMLFCRMIRYMDRFVLSDTDTFAFGCENALRIRNDGITAIHLHMFVFCRITHYALRITHYALMESHL